MTIAPETPEIATPTWLALLAPRPADSSLTIAPEARVRYLHLTWTARAPRGKHTASAIVLGPITGDDDGMLTTEATDADGATVARLRIALDLDDGATPFDDVAVPPEPAPREGTVVGRAIVRPEQVVAHLAGFGLEPRPTTALPGPVVPGLLLLDAAIVRRLQRADGDVEAWFHEPVPVGAIVEVHRGADGEPIELRLPGRATPVVTLRCR